MHTLWKWNGRIDENRPLIFWGRQTICKDTLELVESQQRQTPELGPRETFLVCATY